VSSDLSGEATYAGPIVEIRGLSKTFPGMRALTDVEMDVRPAEIHALLGQNGSGKSTLIKVLAGIYTPDPGAEILVCGERLAPNSPRESRRLGLQFVHQALGIIEELTAVENVALTIGYQRRAGGIIDWPKQREKTRRLLAKLSVGFDIDCPVSLLRPVDRTAIAIARALDDEGHGGRVLVLDEPTAALPPHEVELLFSLVRETRDSGTSVIYVSHRLDEIFELADRATILRDGTVQGTVPIHEIDHEQLVHMIVGDSGPVSDATDGHKVSSVNNRVALRVEELRGVRLDIESFAVNVGEVVGVAGLTGSGREELAGILVGERDGSVKLTSEDGTQVVNPTPRQAKDLGLVLVLPNRAAGAATLELSTQQNMTLPSLERYSRFGFVSRATERRDSLSWIKQLDIRPTDPDHAYALLSGGNQQKVIFGKWLNASPEVMVIDDPTSGVDVSARRAIYDLIRNQAAGGMSVIVCSSDSDDLLAVCDRIIVLNDGTIVDELVTGDIDESHLLMAMVGQAQSGDSGTAEPVSGTS
jgi:ribose transport system ATP-binding protein